MAYTFGDGFDCYATTADAVAGYWDAGATGNVTLITGRFSGSRAIQFSSNATAATLVKSSNVNDGVHHIVVAFQQTGALTGLNLDAYFQLSDGVTPQCSMVFRSDGTMLLTSGAPTGTVLATYAGAISAQSTWTALEIEVVIHNTAGSFAVRKNGNTSNDFTLGSLNTRGGTANNYANKLTYGHTVGPGFTQCIDDLLWRSDASSVPWIGDVRCYTRLPVSDASVQFARSPTSIAFTPWGIGSTIVASNTTAYYVPFTPAFDGTISTMLIPYGLGGTGNFKFSIFANLAGAPSTVMGSANLLVNPVIGGNTVTFSTPVAVSRGTQYWLGTVADVSVGPQWTTTGANSGLSSSVAYASFPTASPTPLIAAKAISPTFTIVVTTNNGHVSETLQDGTTTYVYDNTVGHADFYNLAALASTPAAVIAVTTRGFLQKSDAGTRLAAVQLKSGATTVQSTPAALNTNFGWMYRTDTVDPATGLAWTPTGVSNASIGPIVTG